MTYVARCVLAPVLTVAMLAAAAAPAADAQTRRPGGGTTTCSPVPPRAAGKATLVRDGVSTEYASLEAALTAAAGGDRILLQAAHDYVPQSQSFKLPYKPGAGWITIESDNAAALPAGTRVGPAERSAMPGC